MTIENKNIINLKCIKLEVVQMMVCEKIVASTRYEYNTYLVTRKCKNCY